VSFLLLEQYAPGSAWHSLNSGDVGALAEAKAILKKAQPQPAVDDSLLSKAEPTSTGSTMVVIQKTYRIWPADGGHHLRQTRRHDCAGQLLTR
jgi:hypothetical protein